MSDKEVKYEEQIVRLNAYYLRTDPTYEDEVKELYYDPEENYTAEDYCPNCGRGLIVNFVKPSPKVVCPVCDEVNNLVQ